MDPTVVHYISDTDEDSHDEIDELDSILRSKTIILPIRSNYAWAWGPKEAFRELVQNWRDGIISSFRLPEAEFNVIREERRRGQSIEIIYKVLRPNSEPKEWLGFIRFQGKGVNSSGTVEIVNRKATLRPGHLDMGGTDKAHDSHQAGAHGEGLKIALLVLQRGPQNYNVRCLSGSFTWNFNFTTSGRLVARLNRMKAEQVANSVRAAEKNVSNGIAPFAPSPELDVQFIIGREVSGRDEHGGKLRRQAVTLDQFKSWCETALFLQEVEELGMVGAERGRGDIILDPKLRGNLYLKGLLLSASDQFNSASRTGKPLKYGYNFRSGKVDRERRSMNSSKSEGTSILSIWNKILMNRRPHLVKELSDMLNSSEPEYADVLMAKEAIEESTVIRLKEHLFEDKSKWYFSTSEREKNPRLETTIENLGRTGFQLRDSYWEILSRHVSTLRTADQEQRERFLAAEIVSIPGTSFAQEVDRLLRAFMRACKYTDKSSIEFVKAGSLFIHTFYSSEGQVLRVHERWLNHLQAVQEFGLPHNLNESDAVFHTVKFIFREVLGQMPASTFLDVEDHTSLRIKRKEVILAEQRMIDYHRVKKLTDQLETLDQKNSICEQISEEWGEAGKIEAQLHNASTCAHLRDCLIAADISDEILACTAETRDSHERKRCFSSIYKDDGSPNGCEGEKYFVMVCSPSKPGSMVLFTDVSEIRCQEASVVPKSTERPAEDNSDVEITVSRTRSPSAEIRSQLGASGTRNAPMDLTPSTPPLRIASPRPPSEVDLNDSMGDGNADSDYEPDADVYTLGDRLESLDILTPRDWYEAANRVDDAVIGIPQIQQTMRSSCKRRRM